MFFLKHMFGNQLQKSKLQNVTCRFLTYSIDNKFKCTMVIIKHIVDQLTRFEGLWMDNFFTSLVGNLFGFFSTFLQHANISLVVPTIASQQLKI